MSGWVEAAADEISVDDTAAGRQALARARAASARMRQLIDDYLAFTVAREGLLRPGEVPLSSLAREVVDVYADGDPEPVFDVDVPHTCRADRTLTR